MKRLLTALLALHFLLYGWVVRHGLAHPLDPLTLTLLALGSVTGVYLLRHDRPPIFGVGMMALTAAHIWLGPRLAPDALTSGAFLFVNLLALYAGERINRLLPLPYWIAFVTGYFVLFTLFILVLPNAQPLFLLFLLGLVATARNARLTGYFWAVTASFTFFQPYAWESLLLLLLALTALFGARGASRSATTLTALAIGLVLISLVLLPVLIMMLGENPRNLVQVAMDPRVRDAVRLTAISATLATLLLAAVLTPFAYALSRLRFPGRTILLSLLDLPVVIPQSVAGIALVRVFGRQQAIGEWAWHVFGLRFDGTVLGIILAQVFVGMPFMVRSALAAFDAVPLSLEMQARTLGARPRQVFYRVALPLASRGIFLGAVLAWARAAGEFGAVLFIAPTPETAPIAAYNRFYSLGMVEAAPMVALMLIFSVVMFFLLQTCTRIFTDTHGLKGAET